MVMTIFSIGILGILTLHVTAINSNAKARNIMMGSVIMTDQFEKLISANYASPWLNPGASMSDTENGVLIEHTVSTTPIPNIKKIDLTVSLDGTAGRSVHVAYYKRRPD
jgi:Tfp pilus assembly protein PilV